SSPPKRPAAGPKPKSAKPRAASSPGPADKSLSARQPIQSAAAPSAVAPAAKPIPKGLPLANPQVDAQNLDDLAGELGSRDATPLTRRGQARPDAALTAARTTIPTCLVASALLPMLAGAWALLPVTSPLKIGTNVVPLSLLAGGLACVLSASVLMNYVARRVR
ncbi:MAG: hypothetical protein AAGK78_10490, partial [Planctomycetota bacterium]